MSQVLASTMTNLSCYQVQPSEKFMTYAFGSAISAAPIQIPNAGHNLKFGMATLNLHSKPLFVFPLL